jgi:hypothetical protein
MQLLTFFYISIANAENPFALLQPPLEYSGKVVFDRFPCGPLPLCRQHAHGQCQARMHWGRGGQWNETLYIRM